MKLTYLVAFLLFAVTAVQAQQKRDTVHHAATAKKTKMKDELGLNKKQETDIKASKKEYKAEKEKVKNDTKLTQAQKDEKIKALKEEKKKKVDATLTPEQKEKAKALKAEKKKEDIRKFRDRALATISNMLKDYDITLVIENPAQTIRAGEDWWIRMPYDYGYIAGTEGADGDPVDCFVGNDQYSSQVYVVNQKNAAGEFDETKCMIGFSNLQEAVAAYKNAYTGDSMYVNSIAMDFQTFKNWLSKGDHSKPAE